jgi:hypothetical protein
MGTWLIIGAALVVLIAAVSIKFWSTVRLTSRYRAEQYMAAAEARRLFLLGKITPVLACVAIVALSFFTRLWWVELPACLMLVVITIGVGRIVVRRYAEFHRKPTIV